VTTESEPHSDDSPTNSPLKAVVFDLGGVVFRIDRGERLSRFAQASTLSRIELEAALFGTGLSNDGDRGVFDAETQYRESVARGHLSLDYGQMRDTWASAFSPDEQTVAVIDRLAPALVRATLSDNSELIRFGLEARWPRVMERFSRTFWSYEFRTLKPASEVFERATFRLGCTPAEICFIDDSNANVEAARACGWDAILFEGHPRLEAALRRRGLLTA
jgi:FMN phosphatase YigB (HAD superfamily)